MTHVCTSTVWLCRETDFQLTQTTSLAQSLHIVTAIGTVRFDFEVQ